MSIPALPPSPHVTQGHSLTAITFGKVVRTVAHISHPDLNTTDLTEAQVDEAVRLCEQGWSRAVGGTRAWRTRRSGERSAARMRPCEPAGG